MFYNLGARSIHIHEKNLRTVNFKAHTFKQNFMYKDRKIVNLN